MSAAQPWPRRRRLLRRALPLVGLGVLLVVTALLTPAPGRDEPLDPTSTEPGGTKALVEVLERLDADVEVLERLPATDPDTMLVLIDTLDQSHADRLEEFTRDGGVLVVADPSGRLSAHVRSRGGGFGVSGEPLKRTCWHPALRDVHSIDVHEAPRFRRPTGAVACYRRDGAAWLVGEKRDEGALVTLAGPSLFTNELLDEADNSILAVTLLAPEAGTKVGVVGPSFAIPELQRDPTLMELIPRGLRLATVQLLIAFALMVLWRLRRLGQPVEEPHLVHLPGSELVIAVGNLLQRTGARDRAAEMLRADLRRDLAERLGLPADAEPSLLADTVALRTSLGRDDVLGLLTGPAPGSDAELTEFAQRVERVRHATFITATTGAAGANE